jgi:hypothetical protein
VSCVQTLCSGFSIDSEDDVLFDRLEDAVVSQCYQREEIDTGFQYMRLGRQYQKLLFARQLCPMVQLLLGAIMSIRREFHKLPVGLLHNARTFENYVSTRITEPVTLFRQDVPNSSPCAPEDKYSIVIHECLDSLLEENNSIPEIFFCPVLTVEILYRIMTLSFLSRFLADLEEYARDRLAELAWYRRTDEEAASADIPVSRG